MFLRARRVSGIHQDERNERVANQFPSAWKAGQEEVFVIECKDLKFAKTPNEISEQLNHFSGQVSANGKRDELKKHLDRCSFLNEKSERLVQMIGKVGGKVVIRNVVCFSTPTPVQYVAHQYPDVTFITVDELSKRF